jgi:opacity protein-like surface antigen
MLDTSLDGRTPNGGLNHFTVSENEFAYQGTAGLTYNFAEYYALNVAYRYAAVGSKGDYGKIFQTNLATAGVIYRFDRGNYK